MIRSLVSVTSLFVALAPLALWLHQSADALHAVL